MHRHVVSIDCFLQLYLRGDARCHSCVWSHVWALLTEQHTPCRLLHMADRGSVLRPSFPWVETHTNCNVITTKAARTARGSCKEFGNVDCTSEPFLRTTSTTGMFVSHDDELVRTLHTVQMRSHLDASTRWLHTFLGFQCLLSPLPLHYFSRQRLKHLLADLGALGILRVWYRVCVSTQ